MGVISPVAMALDPLEKERLRRKMATRMQSFLEGAESVECISGHVNETPSDCELCGAKHASELIVIRNRSGKTLRVAVSCAKEMVRFQVADVEELPRWLEKLKDLHKEHEARKLRQAEEQTERRKRLEKRVIVRKRAEKGGDSSR